MTTPDAVHDADFGDELTFGELVFSDFARYRAVEPTWFRVLTRAVMLQGLAATIVLRAQQRLSRRGHIKLASLLRVASNIVWSADFVPGMRIGPGLYMPHPMGVVMGGGFRAGAGVTILQGFTAGAREPHGGTHGYATLCDGSTVSAHSVVLDGVTIGKDALVGANTVVVKDVQERAVVFGVPAKRVATREPDPTPDA
ncbi:serine O-acetyltransferase [Aeromicrobium sp. CTD01-1L150]|uniref:serine O-acetyltransferase n=1 Tax=Aeromicrobium sp. CTD01-1L150 TaxID=3341830 RepID=UPI0035BEE8FC